MTEQTERKAPGLGAEPLKIGYGLALDLGTQKLGAYLYDLASGDPVAETVADSRQVMFGATAAERVAYASDDAKMLRETAVIREQVFDLILELTAAAAGKAGTPVSFADVHYVSIAGNTVMEHLYAATSPKSIGIPPFKPLTLFGAEILAEPTMYFCPCLDGSAGGDLTAALLGSGASGKEEMTLLADLGSDTGLALGNRDGFLCSAAAKAAAGERLEKLLKAGRSGDGNDGTGNAGHSDAGYGWIAAVLVAGSAGMTAEEVEKELEGLLPEELVRKAVFVGNAAGYGAARALCQKGREELKALAAKCRLLS